MVSALGKTNVTAPDSASISVLETSVCYVPKLSIALVGPEESRRKQVFDVLAKLDCGTVHEICRYPERNRVSEIAEHLCDVVLIDLDAHPDHALSLVEHLCAASGMTVMVYAAQSDPASMIRCMRAGVREFLTPPFTAAGLNDALMRVSTRQVVGPATKVASGHVSVFFGAKGGCGVTTIASNFAFMLARESTKKTLLIDLDLPLGDVGLVLGLNASYSTADALKNYERLDAMLLSKVLVQHSPNLFVLASPDAIEFVPESFSAVHKLLAVCRQEFDFVVVDAGSRLSSQSTPLFGVDAQFYMVSRVRIPDLRSANRLISRFFSGSESKLEVVLNRYVPSTLGLDDEQITKALTRPPTWKIPEDSATARKAENAGTPIASSDSDVTKAIMRMARAHAGVAPPADKKKKFLGLFGL
jgi:pilus assembly protein CpaE